MKTKVNKGSFAGKSKELKKLRYSDPIQFDVLYHEWKRKQERR